MRALLAYAVVGAAALTMMWAGPAGAEPGPLVDTRWQLVSIETADQPDPTEVDFPARYTLAFGGDGQAAVRVDCNRGAGRWQATAPSEPSTLGSLRFGPIALTLMACPEPSLGSQVSSMLDGVHSYQMTAGHLSLVGDGGTLNWDAVPTL